MRQITAATQKEDLLYFYVSKRARAKYGKYEYGGEANKEMKNSFIRLNSSG